MTVWLQRIGGEPLLNALFWAIIVLSAMVTVNLTWLMGRAYWHRRTERLTEAFWKASGRQLAQVLGKPEAEAAWVVSARSHPRAVLRNNLNAYLLRTAGEYREGVLRVYCALGLLDDDLKTIVKGSWRRRMMALRRLAGNVTREHRAQIAPLMNSKDDETRLLVAQIIGRIGTADDVLTLLGKWQTTTRLTEYPVHVTINAMPAEELRLLMQSWGTFESATFKRIVLSAAAKKVPAACWALLPEAAKDHDLEVRIAVCRAALRMSSAQSLDLLLALANDPAWEVRAQAVKGLAGHRLAASADQLATALCDGSFWVRQNAAEALCQHGRVGLERLRAVIRTSSDRFARDAARHALTDMNIRNSPEAEVTA
ncbi:MAG: hypothetical protein ACI9MR_000432 [Myxococcota bacterium]